MPHFFKPRDYISSLTHIIGGLLSIIATIILPIKVVLSADYTLTKLISVTIFGLSLIALYFSSGIYHYCTKSDKMIQVLRKLDHSMIYVLIAGTYTPLLLNFFEQPKGAIFTACMWIIAISGIVMKIFWLNAPRWLYTSLYILMGWAIVIDLKSLSKMDIGGIILLVGGGISYTAGAVMYALKKPNISKEFGFHELFHIFVMIGSLLHFFTIFFYVA